MSTQVSKALSIGQINQDVNSVQMVKLSGVIAMTGLSKASIYRLAAADEFPRPFKIGGGSKPRASAWRFSEIADWVGSLQASPKGEYLGNRAKA